MTENNSLIEIEEQTDSDNGELIKEKRGRGRPRVIKPPKENKRKIRSQKQIDSFAKTRELNAQVRAKIKAEKEEHLATVYMEAQKKKKNDPEPISDDDSVSSESSAELTAKEVKQLSKLLGKGKVKPKPKPKPKSKPVKKPKKKPKPKVYESSESESELESESESESEYYSESESEDEPIAKTKTKTRRKIKPRVHIEREPPVPAFNPSDYFV